MKQGNWARLSVIAFPTVMSMRDVAPGWIYYIAGTGAFLLLVIFSYATGVRTPARYPYPTLWLFATMVLAVFGAALAFISGIVEAQPILGNLINIAAAFVLALFIAKRSITAAETMNLLTKALCMLLITSTVFYAIGIEPAASAWKHAARSSMLALIGIDGVRVEFPLTRGLVAHATLCGMTFIAVWFSQASRPFRLLIYSVSLFGMLMTDGRAALLFTLLVIFYGELFRFKGVFYFSFAFIAAAPLYLLAVQTVPASLLSLVARSGNAAELLAGSDRTVIWFRALDHMSHNWQSAIFGAGHFGQLTMGLFGGDFVRYFKNYKLGIESMSLHNAAMQIWVDSGLIGVTITLIFLMVVAKHLRLGRRVNGVRQASAMFCCIILSGAFSTYGTLYWDDGYYALTLIGCTALICIPHEGKKCRPDTRAAFVSGRIARRHP